MEYCTACGRGISPGNQFCTTCGARVQPSQGPQPPRGPRPPGPPWHRRWQAVIVVLLSAAVCGVGIAALLVHTRHHSTLSLSAGQEPASSATASQPATSPADSGSGSPPPSPEPSGSGLASAPPSATPSGSGLASAPPSEQTAAQALAQLLVSSVSDRSAVVAAVSDVNSCGSGLSQDIQTFQQAATSRQRLLSQLSSLSGISMLPAQMIQDLSAAWQASVEADQDFASWAGDENSDGCTPDGSGNASYEAAKTPDNDATTDKKAFVSLWNPIGTQYGLATYTWNQL
jgi:hypothetical protein